MAKKDDPHPILLTKSPWTNYGNNILLATTFSLSRNVEKFLFPGKLEQERSSQIVSLIGQKLLKCTSLKEPSLIKGEESTPVEKEYISEHFLIPYQFQDAHQGQGFVYDETGTFIALLNVENHLHLQITDVTEGQEVSPKVLFSVEEEIEQATPFAFSHKFGYLTSDSKMSGTGFHTHTFLQLTALIHTETLNDVLAKSAEEIVEVNGLFGDQEEWIGDLVVVQNRYTLGVTEENILSTVRQVASRLVQEEEAAREKIRLEKNALILDKVSRSFAVLAHSYQIGAKEAMNAISLLKLGVDLGWVSGITKEKLNELFFMTRRAHLITHYNKEFSSEELLHKRAEFMHDALKEMQLVET